MKIVPYPHPALRWKSKPLTQIDAEIQRIVAGMFELMYASNGIGLAANQVALPYRLFVLNLTGDANEKDEEFVFINPELSRRRGWKEGEEGCLSFPGMYGQVKRSSEIRVAAYGLDGQPFELDLDDLASRAVQHETDHLDGVLFIDRLTDNSRRDLAPVIADFEKAYRRQQSEGQHPPDADVAAELERLEPKLAK